MTLEEVVRSRRSVRRFTDESVPKKTILKLLDMARWAEVASIVRTASEWIDGQV